MNYNQSCCEANQELGLAEKWELGQGSLQKGAFQLQYNALQISPKMSERLLGVVLAKLRSHEIWLRTGRC